MRWYIVTVVLSTEVQKEKIAKLQTKQAVAVKDVKDRGEREREYYIFPAIQG